jgi:hypothetical protein
VTLVTSSDSKIENDVMNNADENFGNLNNYNTLIHDNIDNNTNSNISKKYTEVSNKEFNKRKRSTDDNNTNDNENNDSDSDIEPLSQKKIEILNILTKDPTNFNQALRTKEAEKWKIAINDELNNMYNNKVMEIVDKIPTNANIIDTKWVFTTKDNNTKKARLVAKGFQQIPGQDFVETYSPTVQADSLRLTVAIAANLNWNLKQLDIKAAYQDAKFDYEIYTNIPEGDNNYKKKNKYWLLKKALYELKQAGRMWFNELSKFLKSTGYIQYKTDKCLFGKYNKNKKLISLLTLYVIF